MLARRTEDTLPQSSRSMKQPLEVQKYVTRKAAIEMHSFLSERARNRFGEPEAFGGSGDVIGSLPTM